MLRSILLFERGIEMYTTFLRWGLDVRRVLMDGTVEMLVNFTSDTGKRTDIQHPERFWVLRVRERPLVLAFSGVFVLYG